MLDLQTCTVHAHVLQQYSVATDTLGIAACGHWRGLCGCPSQSWREITYFEWDHLI